MPNPKYDGVIEAVHYTPAGQVDWVRAYVRFGMAWSDRVIIHRSDLIQEIKSGKKMVLGRRVQYMAGTFEVTAPVKVVGAGNQEVLSTSGSSSDKDRLEGAPTL